MLYLSEGCHEAGDFPVILAVHVSIVLDLESHHVQMATWGRGGGEVEGEGIKEPQEQLRRIGRGRRRIGGKRQV